jgi:ADP-ribose pyrophosphatase
VEPWKTRERRKVLDYGKWLLVEDHTIELPDGRIISGWPWIITPDYINVLVETEDGKFLCFEQVKYGIQGTSYAPVGGYIEPGEEPLAAARRELREETGYEAANWIDLGTYLVDPNRGVSTGHLYLARCARLVGERCADDLEEQRLLLLSRVELDEALAAGKFKVLAWMACIVLALRHIAISDPADGTSSNAFKRTRNRRKI